MLDLEHGSEHLEHFEPSRTLQFLERKEVARPRLASHAKSMGVLP